MVQSPSFLEVDDDCWDTFEGNHFKHVQAITVWLDDSQIGVLLLYQVAAPFIWPDPVDVVSWSPSIHWSCFPPSKHPRARNPVNPVPSHRGHSAFPESKDVGESLRMIVYKTRPLKT